MRPFAELYENKVRAIVLADKLPVFSPESGLVSVWVDDTVKEGDIYKEGRFLRPSSSELDSEYRAVFNAQRSTLFTETQWVRERHADCLELGIDDSVNWRAWLEYWQALRDLPNTEGFDPRTPNWPKQPK